jgi:c-di-GMP-binding flagellar brake protein YcgR
VDDIRRIFIFPIPGREQIMWAILIILGFFLLAIFIEVLRRRKTRGLRLAAEWRAIDEIFKEKGFGGDEKKITKAIVARHAALEPMRAITVRHAFNRCVEEHLRDFERVTDTAGLAKRGGLLRDVRMHLALEYIPLGQRIYSTSDLYLQQSVWVTLKPETGTQWIKMTVTVVEEVYFFLSPEGSGVMPVAKVGDELYFRMWREEDARYLFSARLARIENAPHALVLRHAHDLKRTQAREHYRIRYEQVVSIGVINAKVNEDYSDLAQREVVTVIRGKTTSLSGGGFAMIAPQPVPKQVLLCLTLDLSDDMSAIDVTARLVATHSLAAGRYLLRAAFVAMDEEMRDVIAHHVSHKQQQLVMETAERKDRE